MSNENEEENTLASLPTFKSNPNPGKRAEPGQAAPEAPRPPIWESAPMAEVRAAIEAKARELGVSRHDVLDSRTAAGGTDLTDLQARFYRAVRAYHGLPEAKDAPESVALALTDALEDLRTVDAAAPLVAPEVAPRAEPAKPEPQAEAAGAAEPKPAATAEHGDTVTVSKEMYESLLAAAAEVNAKKAAGADAEVSAENIAEAAEAIRQGKPAVAMAAGQGGAVVSDVAPVSGVGQEAAQLTQSVLGAGASLLGGVLKGSVGALRDGVKSLASRRGNQAEPTPSPEVPRKARPMVLPRLSEYRVSQIEDQSNRYGVAQEAFWASGKMPDVRKAIIEKARESGMSVEDVMSKMKPGGELHELHQRYVEAYHNSPAAADHRKAMNKAIDGFVRQYGQAQEEMLAPEQHGNEYFDEYKNRVDGAKDRLFEKASGVPLLDDEDKTNLERLQEAVAKIIEKVREMVAGFTNMLRGKRGAQEEAVSESAP